jgi:transposase InsO family protein
MQKKAAIEQIVGMGLCGRLRACRALGLNRSSLYYRSAVSAAKLAQEGLVLEVSRQWPCLGYEKVSAILRNEHGELVNRKRVQRIRRQHGLMASRGQGKRRRLPSGEPLRRRASRPDEVWSYDFIHDATADGTAVRILVIIDEYTRECLLLRARRSFPARCVIDALEEIMVCTGRKPAYLRSDNGPEFVAVSVRKWLAQEQIGARYIEPGAPWENGFVESLNAQLRAELLNRELFFDLAEVTAALDEWAYQYNFKRPHGSLGKLPPAIAAQREMELRPPASAPIPAGQGFLNN